MIRVLILAITPVIAVWYTLLAVASFATGDPAGGFTSALTALISCLGFAWGYSMTEDRLDDEPAHSAHGPSRADGWSVCADYINANAGLPDIPTFVAAEGTAAHAISDLCLDVGFDAWDAVGWRTQLFDWTFTWSDEDAGLLQPSLDRIRAIPGPFYGERKVDVSPWTVPGTKGRLDRGGYTDEFIWIEDLKWGRWPVYPERHLQNVLYALGFWNDVARHETKATKFLLSIDQPRHAGGGGVWETDLDELLRIGDWLRERAELTMQPNPGRTASEKGCVWCKRRVAPGGCDTYQRFMLDLTGNTPEEMDFDMAENNGLGLPVSTVITPERRAFILSHRKMIETWMDQLEAQELEDYLNGLPTPGRKAVVDTQKGKRAAWKDEAAAEAALVPLLGDRAITKKLITPAQARKQLGSEDYAKVSEHIRSGEAGTSMVPLEDARQPIPVVVADSFEDLLE